MPVPHAAVCARVQAGVPAAVDEKALRVEVRREKVRRGHAAASRRAAARRRQVDVAAAAHADERAFDDQVGARRAPRGVVRRVREERVVGAGDLPEVGRVEAVDPAGGAGPREVAGVGGPVVHVRRGPEHCRDVRHRLRHLRRGPARDEVPGRRVNAMLHRRGQEPAGIQQALCRAARAGRRPIRLHTAVRPGRGAKGGGRKDGADESDSERERVYLRGEVRHGRGGGGLLESSVSTYSRYAWGT